ncbi:MAG: hypothetical protein ACTHWO_10840 [Nesterenkonia sp.]
MSANTASRRIVLPDLTAASLVHAQGMQNTYRDLGLDLTDALHVVLSGDFQAKVILPKDHRDFGTVSPLTGHAAFRVLPADTQLSGKQSRRRRRLRAGRPAAVRRVR